MLETVVLNYQSEHLWNLRYLFKCAKFHSCSKNTHFSNTTANGLTIDWYVPMRVAYWFLSYKSPLNITQRMKINFKKRRSCSVSSLRWRYPFSICLLSGWNLNTWLLWRNSMHLMLLLCFFSSHKKTVCLKVEDIGEELPKICVN